jgi:WD40 repeat protein
VGRNELVRRWDAETGAVLTTHSHTANPLENHVDHHRLALEKPMVAVLSRDGTHVVTAASDDVATAEIWDAETGALKKTLVGHTDRITCCAFSPDGTRVLTASADGTARLWDVPS